MLFVYDIMLQVADLILWNWTNICKQVAKKLNASVYGLYLDAESQRKSNVSSP